MNADVIKKYEEFIGELDYLLGEGVVFAGAEKEKLNALNKNCDAIINSLNVTDTKQCRRCKKFNVPGGRVASLCDKCLERILAKRLLRDDIKEHDEGKCKCDLTEGGYGLCYAGQFLESVITAAMVIQDLG